MPYLRLFLVVLLPFTAISQELIFENISNRLQLPSVECYNVMEDSHKYIWLATEQGLVRYDGKRSEVFGPNNQLPEKAVYAIREDKDGKIWLLTSKNRLLSYHSGKIAPTALRIPSLGRDGRSRNIAYALSLLKDEVIVHSISSTQGLNKSTGRARALYETAHEKDLVLYKSGNQLTHLLSNYPSFFSIDKKSGAITSSICIKDGAKETNFVIKHKSVQELNWRILTCATRRAAFFSMNSKLVKITSDGKHEIFEMPAPIISLYTDKNDGLWIGMRKTGVHYYADAGRLDQPLKSLNNLSVSGIHQDHEGSIWCTTLEDGVFFSASKHIVQYNSSYPFTTSPTFMKSIGNLLFLYNTQQQLFSSPSIHSFNETYSALSKVHHLSFQNNRFRVAQDNYILTMDTNFQQIHKRRIHWKLTDMYIKNVIFESTSDPFRPVYAISHNAILLHHGDTITLVTSLRSTGRCIEYLDDQTLLYGCANGLYSFDIKGKQHHRLGHMDQAITRILVTAADGIWVSTKGSGLYHRENGKWMRMDSILGIPTTVFNDLAIDSTGNLWAASNKGLFKIGLKARNYPVEPYSIQNGLPSNEIFKVAVHDGHLYFSSPKGLGRLPTSISLINQVSPELSLSQAVSGKDTLQINSGIIRFASKNKLTLTFYIPTYKDGKQRLQYLLNGGNEYAAVDGNEISFHSLPPDQYLLTVFAVNSDGVKSSIPYVATLIVDPPFWRRGWFAISGIIPVILLVLWLRRVQIRVIENKEREKNRINTIIAQSKLSALQARMNPHFIFNCINSIQNFILKNQPEAAQQYLVKFSRLIRIVLNQSASKTINLKEEIETLHLYVDLEKLRFKNSFAFILKVDPAIQVQSVYLPTMLIQPYVENAIWHGINNLNGQRAGIIQLDFSVYDHQLLITLTDNGIGRKQADQLKVKKNYSSKGMMLTEERLQTLRSIFPDEIFKVEIQDSDEGTTVRLTLSLEFDLTEEPIIK